MSTTEHFFQSPSLGIVQIYTQSYHVIKVGWKTLGLIAVLTNVAFHLVGILLFLLFIALFMDEIKTFLNVLSTNASDGPFRNLLEFSHRALDGYAGDYSGSSYNSDISTTSSSYFNFDLDADDDFVSQISSLVANPDMNKVVMDSMGKIIFFVVVVALVFVFLSPLLSCLFDAAFQRTAAEIFAGFDPERLFWKSSLLQGRQKMCPVYCYSVARIGIFWGLLLALMLFCALTTVVFGTNGFSILLFLVAICVWLYADFKVMIGTMLGVPMIVIQHLPACNALSASWAVSKNHTCLIFCTLFLYVIGFFVAQIIINQLIQAFFLNFSPGLFVVLTLLVGFALSLFNIIASQVIQTALYIALRTRAHGLTQQELLDELSKSTTGMELSDVKYSLTSVGSDEDETYKSPMAQYKDEP